MKRFVTPSYTFDASAKTLDLSAIAGFNIKNLVAVINQTDGIIIYATGDAAKGYTDVTSGVVTLSYDTTSMSDTDTLQIIYDEAIPATGYKLVKASATVTRPSDTTAYTIGDAITNSTSSPTVFELDLSSLGAVSGQAVEIRRLSVVSSAKQTVLPLINLYLANATFTSTNDNSALSIDDTTMEAGGAWIQCDTQNSATVNSVVEYRGAPVPMLLASNDQSIFGVMQAANAYTPVSGEKFTILAWIALL